VFLRDGPAVMAIIDFSATEEETELQLFSFGMRSEAERELLGSHPTNASQRIPRVLPSSEGRDRNLPESSIIFIRIHRHDDHPSG